MSLAKSTFKKKKNTGLPQSLKRVQPKLCYNQTGLPQNSVKTMFKLQIWCKTNYALRINLSDMAIWHRKMIWKEILNKRTLLTSGHSFCFLLTPYFATELKLAEAIKQTALFLSLTGTIITNLTAFFSPITLWPRLYYDYTLLYPSKCPIKHCSITVRLLSGQNERHRRWESWWVLVSTCLMLTTLH